VLTETMALPPSFVISLERDEKRVENIRDNILNIIPECEIIAATDGRSVNIFDVDSLISTNPSYRLNPFVIACHLSHLEVLRLIVERRLPSAVVFEDDVKVVPDFRNRLDLLLDELPDDYEYIYLYTHPKYRLEDDTPFLILEKTHIRKYSYTYGTLACLVSFNGAKTLVNYLSQRIYAPLDFMLNDLIDNGELAIYMSRTTLVENLGQLTSIYNNELLPSNVFPPNSFLFKAWHSLRRLLID
jgi:GR25 family glycosyltransferase involved in LPS biosynthesis